MSPEPVADAYTAPPPPEREAPPPEPAGKRAKMTDEERKAKDRERKRRGRPAGGAPRPAPTSSGSSSSASTSKPQPEPAPAVELPGDPGSASMKLTKREAQALFAQVFSLPASMLEPQLFGCVLVPGEVARLRVSAERSLEIAIPEHLETTKKAAIEGLSVLAEGVEIDPRWVAAGMVAVHALNVGMLYYQLSQLLEAERKAARAQAAEESAEAAA
jgi:hypothetical protein